ncbi:MFS transporter [Paenalcaligenes sp. Me131]|uniref:MFS transporter n=1 Tax=Paenalcaligenes sp. Me131 TaxID=3392636 RepID=UPI003D2A1512
MRGLTKLFANATQSRPLLTVVAIFLGAVLTTVQGRLFSSALPDLRGQFGLDVLEAAWLGTALNGAQLISMPLAPWFATVVGATRVVVIPSVILGVAAVSVPLFMHHYPMLLGLHAVIGLCLGVYLPLTISLALRSVQPRFWLIVMAAYSLRVSTGMDGGMGVSAFLVEEISWHWVYWAAAIMAPMIAWLAWKAMPLTPVDKEGLRQADWAGMALLCLGLVMVFVGMESAERLGWWDSGLVVSTIAGGALLFGSAVIRAVVKKNAFGHLLAFGNRNICLCMLLACLFGIVMTPTSLLVPSFLTQMGGLKPMQTSTATWIAFLAYFASTPFTVYLARRVEPRLMIVSGLIIIAATAWLGTHISHDWRVDQFVSTLILQSLGENVMLVGLIAAFVTNLNPVHGVALGVYVPIARVMTPVVSGTIMTTWLRMTGDSSYTALRSAVQNGDPIVMERATAGVSHIASVITRESHVLAHIAGYNFVFWTSIVALLLAVFLRSSPPNPIAPPFAVAAK